MALQKTILADTGVTHVNAYIKVHSYSCDVDNTINARLRAYASRQHAHDGKAHLEGSEDIVSIVGDYSENADNAKKQIYDKLKLMDNYLDAVDILE